MSKVFYFYPFIFTFVKPFSGDGRQHYPHYLPMAIYLLMMNNENMVLESTSCLLFLKEHFEIIKHCFLAKS